MHNNLITGFSELCADSGIVWKRTDKSGYFQSHNFALMLEKLFQEYGRQNKG